MSKKTTLVAIAALVVLATIAYQVVKLKNKLNSSQVAIETNSVLQKLPNLKLPIYDKSDEFLDLSEKSAFLETKKVIFLHFWATWCGPCEKEFPELKKLVSALKGNPAIGFVFVAVNDSAIEIKKFLKKQQLETTSAILVLDNKNVFQDYFGIYRLPETYVFKNRKVVQKFSGGKSWSENRYIQYLNRLTK